MRAGSLEALRRAGVLLAVGIALVAAPGVRADQIATESMFIKLDATITPKALPRGRPKPVAIKIEASLRKRRGRNLPRLTRVQLSLNKAAALSGSGQYACRYADIAAASSSQAERRCPGALIGHGRVKADVRYPGQRRSKFEGNLRLFNGLIEDRRPAILLHVFSAEPRTAAVMPFVISKPSGLFGTVLTARVRISRWVSIRHFVMTLGRQPLFRGGRTRYLAASCPVPRGFTAGIAPFARMKFGFDNGSETDHVIVRTCRIEE